MTEIQIPTYPSLVRMAQHLNLNFELFPILLQKITFLFLLCRFYSGRLPNKHLMTLSFHDILGFLTRCVKKSIKRP